MPVGNENAFLQMPPRILSPVLIWTSLLLKFCVTSALFSIERLKSWAKRQLKLSERKKNSVYNVINLSCFMLSCPFHLKGQSLLSFIFKRTVVIPHIHADTSIPYFQLYYNCVCHKSYRTNHISFSFLMLIIHLHFSYPIINPSLWCRFLSNE